jgi:hypothetical protein
VDEKGRITAASDGMAGGGSGTVTSVGVGAGLALDGNTAGGTITTSGTISLPTLLSGGTVGSSTQIPVLTLDSYGRVTSANTAAVSPPTKPYVMFGITGTLAHSGTGNVINWEWQKGSGIPILSSSQVELQNNQYYLICLTITSTTTGQWSFRRVANANHGFTLEVSGFGGNDQGSMCEGYWNNFGNTNYYVIKKSGGSGTLIGGYDANGGSAAGTSLTIMQLS